MQRYFAKDKIANRLILFDSDEHHIKNVMRGKIADQIEVVYDGIVYLCQITSLAPLEFEIVNELSEKKDLKIDLSVAVALVQEQKFDLILLNILKMNFVFPFLEKFLNFVSYHF